jgi:voltage-gated potassium channel
MPDLRPDPFLPAPPPVAPRPPRRRPGWIGGAMLTACLLGLIALSIRVVSGDLAFVLLGSVAVVVAIIHRKFPGSQFFSLALANFIGAYACVFALFLESNFHTTRNWAQMVGFALPLASFLLGALMRADEIRDIVLSRKLRDAAQFGRVFLWMAPVALIGAATFGLPARGLSPDEMSMWFLGAMGAIALIIGLAARDVSVFLLDAGLLFEGFFQQAARLLVPAFAFLTFYSLNIIVFGTIYTIMDRFSVEPNFLIHGQPQKLTFTEGLYFSLVTFATVGYGDVSPLSGAVRIIAAIEIVLGVLLLLFGFSAIIGHAAPNDRRHSERDPW